MRQIEEENLRLVQMRGAFPCLSWDEGSAVPQIPSEASPQTVKACHSERAEQAKNLVWQPRNGMLRFAQHDSKKLGSFVKDQPYLGT